MTIGQFVPFILESMYQPQKSVSKSHIQIVIPKHIRNSSLAKQVTVTLKKTRYKGVEIKTIEKLPIKFKKKEKGGNS